MNSQRMLERKEAVDFESASSTLTDETDLALRYYIANMPDEKVRQYRTSWSDEQTVDWCDDFRSDGNLMLVCCERDVDVAEFRRVLEEYLIFRGAGSLG